jgi:hypothetical protein
MLEAGSSSIKYYSIFWLVRIPGHKRYLNPGTNYYK